MSYCFSSLYQDLHLWVTKFCADPNECYFYNLPSCSILLSWIVIAIQDLRKCACWCEIFKRRK